ncbi:hypothetical protein SUNI508_13085 [Seiridium unicorne]|uniref:Uncharacterized protein n=1 Tax=Seiridium unicorne TaxID=138068 RepID=A0ABR2VET4_9PEZI
MDKVDAGQREGARTGPGHHADLHAAAVRIILEELLKEIGNIGYHIAHWSIGTKDFEHDTESQSRVSIKRFDKDLEAGGAVALTHDTKFYTADKLLPHMIA